MSGSTPARSSRPSCCASTGCIGGGQQPLKVLARGEVGKALTVRAHKFSGKAAEKIAAAGGTAEALAADESGLIWNSLKNIFAVSDLRNRVLFTLGLLGVYRVGHHITVPGVNLGRARRARASRCRTTMFGLYDMFSGGNLSKVTIFALGIMPYISASIILQLLTVVWPYLEKLSKEGELGRRKITQYTRYGTILLSVVQALGIAIFLERQTTIAGGLPLVYNPGWRSG